MADVDPKLLRAFLNVAKAQSFTAAARIMGCSQGTVSLRVRALENQLGQRLLDRSGRSVTLTPAGRELLPNAQTLVDMHDRLFESAASRSVAGPVRLGVAQTYAIPLLSELLKPIVEKYPAIEFNIQCTRSIELEQKILARVLDLAIVSLFEETPSAPVLCRPHLHWVAAPDFELDVARPIPFTGFYEPCLFRSAALAALEQSGIAYRETLQTSDEQAVLGAVAGGTAITVMAEGTIPADLRIVAGSSTLPNLGRTRIQLLERPGLASEAAQLVKRRIAKYYRNFAARLRTAGESETFFSVLPANPALDRLVDSPVAG